MICVKRRAHQATYGLHGIEELGEARQVKRDEDGQGDAGVENRRIRHAGQWHELRKVAAV
jgi:hypothetical protein